MCYGTFTNVFNEETGETVSFSGESGCTMDLGEGSVIERDLSAAIIAPATITLETIVCDAIECAPTGETRETRSKARSRRPRLRRARPSATSSTTASASPERSRGTERNATLAGTADGQPLEVGDPDGFAVIHQGTFSSSTKCAIEG